MNEELNNFLPEYEDDSELERYDRIDEDHIRGESDWECVFPGECLMPGPHHSSECHTVQMITWEIL